MCRVESNIKRKLFSFALFVQCVVVPAIADIAITNVRAEPISPWGKVFVSYDITGTVPETNTLDEILFCLSVSNRTTAVVSRAKTIIGDVALNLGTHKILWDFSADGVELEGDAVTFSVRYDIFREYLIVDLSGGPTAATYPISSMRFIPAGGWTDEYKTMKLVLRRIEPGSWSYITIPETYYIGIFEVTQKQYELVMGSQPSNFSGDTLPVEKVDNVAKSGMRFC